MRIPCLGPTGSHRTAGCPSPCSAPRARPPPLSCLSLQGMEDDPSWRDASRPRGQWRLVWACRASEEGLARRWVTLSCADVPQAWQGSTSHPVPRPQEAAGVACGWEHFPELPFWAALTREAQEVAAAGSAADRPVCATPSVAPGSLLLGGCVTALEPNLLCPAVSATGAAVDRASNRDLWGYGCQVARGTSRPGARAQRICPGPRVSSGRIGRARAKPGRSRGSLSRARGGEGPRSGA